MAQSSAETVSTPVLDDDLNVSHWLFWKRRRYVLAYMICVGLASMFALRDLMGVTIVAMTSPVKGNGNDTQKDSQLSWDTNTQGWVLGSYYYGYISTHMLGGWLAGFDGGYHVLSVGIGVSALINLLVPTLAMIDVYWVIAARILQGICHGGCQPSMLVLWAHWTPPPERNRLASISYTGAYIGSLLVMATSGVIAQQAHWSVVFYVFGGLGLLWYAAWVIIVRQRPELDPYMDPRELKYLQKTVSPFIKNIKHPWGKIFTSRPVWAAALTMLCQNWGYYTLLTQMPMFISDVLHFDIQQTGLFSALPYIIVTISSPLTGLLADWVVAKNFLTKTQVRKSLCCTGMILEGLFAFLPAVYSTPAVAVTALSLVVGVEALPISVLFTNYLDLSPQHSGILFGIQSMLSTIPGIISPTILGLLIPNGTASEWRTVFYITGSLYLLGALVYGILASGEEEDWSAHEDKEDRGHTNEGYQM